MSSKRLTINVPERLADFLDSERRRIGLSLSDAIRITIYNSREFAAWQTHQNDAQAARLARPTTTTVVDLGPLDPSNLVEDTKPAKPAEPITPELIDRLLAEDNRK